MPPQLRREEPPGRLRRQDGHGPPAGIPEGVAAVVEGGEGDLTAIPMDAQGQALALHPLPCRRPEDDAQQKVGREGRDEQHPQVHPGVENAPLHRHPVGEHPQRQHAARHAAGEGEEQQHPPKETPLSAKGNDCHQKARQKLSRPGGEPPQPRQEDRSGVAPAEERRETAAPPPRRDTGEQLRPPEEKVVHGGIQQEYAVQIHHRHPLTPFPAGPLYPAPGGKTVAKGGRAKQKPSGSGRTAWGDIPFGGTAQLGYCQPRPLSSLRLRFMSSPTTSLAGLPW